MEMIVKNEEQMKEFGRQLGAVLRGRDLLELVGDVGAGKTTLTKGLAMGLDIGEPIQSPTFTISRTYAARDGLEFRHYDFYRLNQAGIMADELDEIADDPGVIVAIEWAGAVGSVLSDDRLIINIEAISETERRLNLVARGQRSMAILEQLT